MKCKYAKTTSTVSSIIQLVELLKNVHIIIY